MTFAVAPEVAFDYLADPHNRPLWQSSLDRVEDVDGDVRVGQTWVDVTRPGLRPRMETAGLDRPRRWSERGTWRGFSATLTLEIVPTAAGCAVTPTMRLAGSGVAAPAAWLLGRIAPFAVRADLRTAASRLTA